MSVWRVTLGEEFAAALEQASEASVDEVLAIQLIAQEGPTMLGATDADLEGVPAWINLGSPISLRLPNPVDPRRAMQVEVWPGYEIVIRWID